MRQFQDGHLRKHNLGYFDTCHGFGAQHRRLCMALLWGPTRVNNGLTDNMLAWCDHVRQARIFFVKYVKQSWRS